jgi:hypothetical protein
MKGEERQTFVVQARRLSDLAGNYKPAGAGRGLFVSHSKRARVGTRIIMATVPHVTSGSGLRKFQSDGFLSDGVYFSLNMSRPYWSYKGTFLYTIYLLHAHYMIRLFHLHWSNYIMKCSNNKPHFIIFCVFLILTPSIG